MCGRFTLTVRPDEILARFGVQKVLFEPKPRFNLAPTQIAPVVLQQDGERVIDGFKWGLLPFWAKDEKAAFKTVNARIEGLREHPPTASYRAALKDAHRCIVPADGFYEWKVANPEAKPKDQVKLPYYFRFRDKRLFSMAGLWQSWTGPDAKTGEKVHLNTFTIVTALPIKIAEDIHDRSPVILTRDNEAAWLDPSVSSDEALDLLNPYEDYHAMEVFQVQREVGNVRNDFPALIEPVTIHDADEDAEDEQGSLF